MAYGEDITESIPFPVGNPVSNQIFTPTGVAYDIAIGGQPFFISNDDNNPYRRVTAQYRKNQVDMSREPGEQTITGWWLRSQSSFHYGQGIKFFEPAQDESLRFQFKYTKGCNVWEKGQVTLLNDLDTAHTITGQTRADLRPNQYTRSIQWTKNNNLYDGVLLSDDFDIDKVFPEITVSITNKALTSSVATLTTSAPHGLSVGMQIVITDVDSTFDGEYRITGVPTTSTFTYAKSAANVPSTPVSPAGTGIAEVIHFVDYTSGTDDKVFGICDDGVYAYWVTNDTLSGKIEFNKKLLTEDSSTPPTVMFTQPGITVTNAVLEFTKERIVAAINNKVYEIATTATSLPSPVYTNLANDFIYTSITSSGNAIYLTGFSGIQSTIQKFTLATNGTMPTLTSAITAAELPVGERAYKIFFYLSLMCIGTDRGVRIAAVDQSTGSIAYGPLLFESEQPVYDFAARDKYIWCATNVDGNPGVTRIDLGQPVGSLIYAYAWDLYDPTVTGFNTTACAFLGDTSRLLFVTANNGTADGKIYIQSLTRLVQQGELETGFVRYNTLENKIFKFITPRCNTATGGIRILSVDSDNNSYNIGFFTQQTEVGDIPVSYPPGSQQYLGFKFLLSRSTVDPTKGPLFTGYQLKVLLAVPRQRLLQFPVHCYDSESDKFGNKSGYEGSAFDRLTALESIESNGDTIKIEDFRSGETLTGIIEEIDFVNKTPTDKRYSGYGGLLVITIRTMS